MREHGPRCSQLSMNCLGREPLYGDESLFVTPKQVANEAGRELEASHHSSAHLQQVVQRDAVTSHISDYRCPAPTNRQVPMHELPHRSLIQWSPLQPSPKMFDDRHILTHTPGRITAADQVSQVLL